MRHKSAAYVTWGILMALSLPAYAAEVQDTDQGVMTKDVVVTATRTEAEVKTVPQTVEVITAEDIEKLGATDVYSALRLADNIQIMQYQHRLRSPHFHARHGQQQCPYPDQRPADGH